MITTAIIAFREFLEVFLILGLFLGISKKLKLKKETEIIFAGFSGILFSFLLISSTYFFGDYASHVLIEHNAGALESYLLIFSGVFIVYVVFSLHKAMNRHRHEKLLQTQDKIKEEVFDLSLFLTIVFLALREGLEIALFTASTSLFSPFFQNFIGLVLGFLASGVISFLIYFAYVKISLKRVFQITEYFIILLGAALFQNGITKLLAINFNVYLSNILSLHLEFLPNEDTFIGGFLQNFLGLDNRFSLARLMIMLAYATLVYLIFIDTKAKTIK